MAARIALPAGSADSYPDDRMTPRTFSRIVALSLWLLASLAVPLGCKPSPGPAPGASASAAAAAKPYPKTVAEAEALKSSGASWTNQEIRVHYTQVVATIGPSNEEWKKQGLPAEERARRAFALRHDARLTCRAMMASASEVEDLRRRDQDKYGQADGPTFDQLVEHNKKNGATGDAVYEAIIASAQRTDELFNAAFGILRWP
jgi:hypothetical protein